MGPLRDLVDFETQHLLRCLSYGLYKIIVFFYGGKRTQQFAKMRTVEGGGLGSLGPQETSLYGSSRVWGSAVFQA